MVKNVFRRKLPSGLSQLPNGFRFSEKIDFIFMKMKKINYWKPVWLKPTHTITKNHKRLAKVRLNEKYSRNFVWVRNFFFWLNLAFLFTYIEVKNRCSILCNFNREGFNYVCIPPTDHPIDILLLHNFKCFCFWEQALLRIKYIVDRSKYARLLIVCLGIK